MRRIFGVLGPLLLKTLNYSFENGELSTLQKHLPERKDRDVTMIKNWKPFSLINVEGNITSKALAARMKTVIHSLISYDQTTLYVKGRHIGESVRLIDNLLKYAEGMKILMESCLQLI